MLNMYLTEEHAYWLPNRYLLSACWQIDERRGAHQHMCSERKW